MKSMVCHGDSLTAGDDLECGDTWTALVAEALDMKVVNSGINGDTTGGLLGRFYIDVVGHQPDIVLILAGTNDVWWDLAINSIQANIFAMTSQAQFHNIVPVIGLPLPLYVTAARQQDFAPPVGGYDKCRAKLHQLVAGLQQSTAEYDIAVIDFYHLFINRHGGVQGKYFLQDGLHANRAGQQRMANKVVELLKCLPGAEKIG